MRNKEYIAIVINIGMGYPVFRNLIPGLSGTIFHNYYSRHASNKSIHTIALFALADPSVTGINKLSRMTTVISTNCEAVG